MYCLLLLSLQIEENEVSQGFLQVEIFWNFFWKFRLARIGAEMSYSKVALWLET